MLDLKVDQASVGHEQERGSYHDLPPVTCDDRYCGCSQSRGISTASDTSSTFDAPSYSLLTISANPVSPPDAMADLVI